MAETEYDRRLRELEAAKADSETEYDKRLRELRESKSKTSRSAPILPDRVEVPTFETYDPAPMSMKQPPEPTMSKSVEFKPTPGLQQDLYDVTNKNVQDAFLVDYINDTEEAKQKRAAEARAQAEQVTDYTPGGEPYTTFVEPGWYVTPTEYVDDKGNWNPLLTKSMESLIEEGTKQTEGGRLGALRPQVVDPGFNLRQGQYAQNIATLSDELDHYSKIKSNPDFASGLRNSILEAWDAQPKVRDAIVVALDKIDKSTDPDEIEVAKESAKQVARNDAPTGGFLLAEDAKGRLVETNPMYALRMLNAPTAAIAGGIEGAYTSLATGQPLSQLGTDIANAATRYVREGRGFSDLGSQALGRVGHWADIQAGNTDPEFETIGSGLGGMAGLYADVMSGPVDAMIGPAKFLGGATKTVLKAAESVPVDAVNDVARLGSRVADKVASVPAKLSEVPSKVSSKLRPLVGLSKDADDAVVSAASNNRISSIEARGEDPLTAVRNDTLSQLADDMVALDTQRLAFESNVPKKVAGETDNIGTKRVARNHLYDVAKSRIEARGGIAVIAKRFEQAGLVNLTPTADEVAALNDGTLTSDKFFTRRLFTLAKEIKPLDSMEPDELALFSSKDQPIDRIYMRDLLKSLRAAVDKAQAESLITNLSNASLPEASLIVSGLDRITPGRFVSVRAVEPIMGELEKRMAGWVPEKVGDTNMMRRGEQSISIQEYRDLVTKTTDDIINEWSVFSIKASELADIANRLDAKPRPSLTNVRALTASLLDQINSQPVRNLFLPKEVQPSILGSIGLAIGRLAIEAAEVGPRKEFLDTVANAWGSIFDIFRRDIKLATKSGLSTQDAFAKVVMANPNEYFDRYLRVFYGLNDTLDEIYQGEKTSIGPDPKPWIWNRGLDWLISGPLASKKAEFIELYNAGKYSEASNLLQQVSAVLSGRKLGTIPGFSDAMRELNLSVNEISTINQAIPAFSVDDFMKLTSVAYSRAKQSELLMEAVANYTSKYEDLFGSGGIEGQIRKWKEHGLSSKLDRILNSEWRLDDETQLYANRYGSDEREYFGGYDEAKVHIKAMNQNAIDLANVIEEIPGVFEALVKAEALNRIATIEASRLGISPTLYGGLTGLIQLWDDLQFKHGDNWLTYLEANPKLATDAILSSHSEFDLSMNQQIVRRLLTGGDYLSGKNTLFDTIVDDILRFYGPKTTVNLDAVKQAITKTISANIDNSIVDQINEIVLHGPDSKMRRALAEASDVDSISRVLSDILLPNDKKLASADALEFTKALEVSIDKLKKFIPKAPPSQASWFNRAFDAFARANAWAKAGMLGGVWLPNLGYHVANAMTAPLIVLNTLGPEMAKASMFNMNGLKIMRGLMGQLPPTTLVQFGKPGASRLFTMGELIDMIVKGSIQKSQAGIEMSKSMIDDMVMYSGAYSWGDAARSWLRAPGSSRELADLANASDTFFRINVFAKAMENGSTPEQALKLARESLYDYGSLTKFERKWLSKGLLFYTFWSRNLLQTGINVLNDLTRPGHSRLAKAYRVQQALTSSEPNYDADYSTTKLGRFILDNPQYSLKGPGIPQEEALSELVNYLGTVTQPFGISKNTALASKNVLETALEQGGAQWFSRAPLLAQAIIGVAFKKELVFGKPREFSDTIDPRLFHYLEQDPRMFDYLAQLGVHLEKVEPDKVGGGTYDNAQYRIKKADRERWFIIQTLATHLALKRMLSDYAEVSFGPDPSVGLRNKPQPDDLFDYRIQSQGPIEWGLRSSGALSPVANPTLEQRQEQILKGKISSLKEE